MFEMLVKLDTAVHDLVMANLCCQSQLEEARRSAEVTVAAAVTQFGAELRMREAAHEQTLEAVVARYAEKEALRVSEAAATVEQAIKSRELVANTEPVVQDPTFSQVLRQTREMRTESSRKMDRSKSRADRRNKLVREAKKEEHLPAYVVKDIEGKSSAATREVVWRQVAAKKPQARCHSVKTIAGKTIIKPLDRETADVLKHLSTVSTLLEEDSFRWPRVKISGVMADANMDRIQGDIIKQNESLEIPVETKEVILKPIYKTGPRDRDTTIWVMEVNPKYYKKFKDTMVYLGFMRCRVSAHEKATQCHLCLRYGHPAAKCVETQCVCARERAISRQTALHLRGSRLVPIAKGNTVRRIRPARLGRRTYSDSLGERTTEAPNECRLPQISATQYEPIVSGQRPTVGLLPGGRGGYCLGSRALYEQRETLRLRSGSYQVFSL